MKTIYSIVAATVLCTTVFGQTQKKIDSILIRLSEVKTIDTARISSFNSLSYYYYSVNPELGIKYADAALQLATKFKSKNHIAQAYQSFALNYTMQGENSIAQKYYQKSLDLAIRIKNQSVEAHAYHGLAYLNSIQ